MTPRPDIKLSRRLQLPIAMARSMLSATLMIVVYYAVPFDHPLDFRVLVWLGVGLAALAVGLAYQVRSIVVADAPRVRAMETLAIGLPFLLLLYASVYTILAVNEPASFTQVLDRTDALYFTMTVFTTVGFGDIAPATHLARVMTMTQMVIGLVAVGLVARLLFGAVQIAVNRRVGEESTAHSDAEAHDR